MYFWGFRINFKVTINFNTNFNRNYSSVDTRDHAFHVFWAGVNPDLEGYDQPVIQHTMSEFYRLL